MSAMLFNDDGEPIGRIADIVRMLAAPPEQADHDWLDDAIADVMSEDRPPRRKRRFYRARHAVKARFLP